MQLHPDASGRTPRATRGLQEAGLRGTSEQHLQSDPATIRALFVATEPGAGSAHVAAALARLGTEVELLCAGDASTVRRLCERRPVDLLVLDPTAESAARELLAPPLPGRPPLVCLVPAGDRERPLELHRLGAADCVELGEELEEVLATVALEQIRRAREERARGADRRRIRWLEGLNDAIVRNLPAGLAVVDRRGRAVVVNPEFARAFGVTAEAARGRPLAELLPLELWQSAELPWILAAGEADRRAGPRCGRTADGRSFDVRAQRLDEEAGRVLLVLADVSERERLARRIAELQQAHENILHSLNGALLVLEGDGTVRTANAVAEELVGATTGALAGHSIWEWLDQRGPAHMQVRERLERGLRLRGAETLLKRSDGSVVPVSFSCAPLEDGAVDPPRSVVILEDLSEIKQLQRQVLQTEKLASIGQLAAGVAHEINNPMGFVHANLHQMNEYLADLRSAWEDLAELRQAARVQDLDAVRVASERAEASIERFDVDYVLRDFATAIRESQEGSERVRHIVQDLRDFSYQDTAERVPADVNQCVDSTASIVWTMMKHAVTLKKDYADLPPVSCYPMQLKQVFMNLLVNAYQSIEARIEGTHETGEVHIRTWRNGDHVAVSISDTGTGIQPEDLDRIFDPFFTTKQVGSGTGLGLSTSYSIVQRHGGTLSVESRRGHGSVFEVRLPIGGDPSSVEGWDDPSR